MKTSFHEFYFLIGFSIIFLYARKAFLKHGLSRVHQVDERRRPVKRLIVTTVIKITPSEISFTNIKRNEKTLGRNKKKKKKFTRYSIHSGSEIKIRSNRFNRSASYPRVDAESVLFGLAACRPQRSVATRTVVQTRFYNWLLTTSLAGPSCDYSSLRSYAHCNVYRSAPPRLYTAAVRRDRRDSKELRSPEPVFCRTQKKKNE